MSSIAHIYKILRRSYHLGHRSVERLRKQFIFLNKHLNDDCSDLLSPYERIHSMRKGFLPKSVVLYNGKMTRCKYLSDRENARIRANINEGYESVTRNKLLFHQLFKSEFDEVLPTVFGIITSSRVLSDTDECISNSSSSWLQTVISNNNTVICKPVRASGGEGVYLAEAKGPATVEVNGHRISLYEFSELLMEDGPYLITEHISQHSYSNNIYPQTVNTLRLNTYRHPTTERMFIAAGFHRFGTFQSYPVDNWDEGGIAAEVDLETGELGKAIKQPTSRPVDWFSKHPDTEQDIDGVQIPQWDQIISKVLGMSEYLQYYDLLAWDLVLTDDGITVIALRKQIVGRVELSL